MFRMPGLLLILVVAYAIYSLIQSRKLRQSTYQSTGGYQQRQSSANASSRKRDQDIFDVEYTEHEL